MTLSSAMASSSLLLLLLLLLLSLPLPLPLPLPSLSLPLEILRALFLFAGVLLTGDSSSLLSTDLSFSSLRLGVLVSRGRRAPDDAADVGLRDGLLALCFSFSPTRVCGGGSCRRFSGGSAAGAASRDRLDDDVEDPADSPVPWVSLLLTPFFIVPAASGSAFPNSSCPGWKTVFIRCKPSAAKQLLSDNLG
jgi:hypothetical protein